MEHIGACQLCNLKKGMNPEAHLSRWVNACEDLKRVITIVAEDEEAMQAIKESIHNQLVGNQDYIDNNIILNGSDDRNDRSENTVCVYIFQECEHIPKLTLDFNLD